MKAEKQISSDQKDQWWRRWEEDREEIRVCRRSSVSRARIQGRFLSQKHRVEPRDSDPLPTLLPPLSFYYHRTTCRSLQISK